MKDKFLISFVILIFSCSFSQKNSKETEKLIEYKFIKKTTFLSPNWIHIIKLQNGIEISHKNYIGKKFAVL